MKFQLFLTEKDAQEYGDEIYLDKDQLEQDTPCDDLIAWEEEADFSLHLLWQMHKIQPVRWKRALLWFALKQSGSDIAFSDLTPTGIGGMLIKRVDKGDAVPPVETSSEDQSEPAS